MLETALPFLKLAGFLAYCGVVFYVVRRVAAAHLRTWSDRKNVLFLLMLCALPLMAVEGAVRSKASVEITGMVPILSFAALIAAWFAILLAPIRGSR